MIVVEKISDNNICVVSANLKLTFSHKKCQALFLYQNTDFPFEKFWWWLLTDHIRRLLQIFNSKIRVILLNFLISHSQCSTPYKSIHFLNLILYISIKKLISNCLFLNEIIVGNLHHNRFIFFFDIKVILNNDSPHR